MNERSKITRRARVLAKKYGLLALTINVPIISFVQERNLAAKIDVMAIYDYQDKLHWFTASGDKLPKSIGWTLRELARQHPARSLSQPGR